jgi:dihydrodipicolinate synthase/N-acetylneuraminate lyase
MRFPGIIPAVTTPFDANGAVDAAGIAANVRFLLDAGCHGVVGTGTMGEAGSLDREERRLVLETVAEAVDGAVPLIAGVSAGTAAASVAYARDAVAAGAGAVMCLPPLGYRADLAELIAFYDAVAAGAGVPVMLYNNPEASGVDLRAEQIVAIADRVPGIVAVKECSGDVRRIPALLAAAPQLETLVGGDDWALEGFAAGATGWVTGVADVAPRECVALYEHCLAGELEPAREIYRRLLPLARFDMTPKLVQYFKAAQDEVGLAGGPCREPRLPLTTGEREALAAALAVLREGVPA